MRLLAGRRRTRIASTGIRTAKPVRACRSNSAGVKSFGSEATSGSDSILNQTFGSNATFGAKPIRSSFWTVRFPVLRSSLRVSARQAVPLYLRK